MCRRLSRHVQAKRISGWRHPQHQEQTAIGPHRRLTLTLTCRGPRHGPGVAEVAPAPARQVSAHHSVHFQTRSILSQQPHTQGLGHKRRAVPSRSEGGATGTDRLRPTGHPELLLHRVAAELNSAGL